MADATLVAALERLWRLHRPGPDNLLAAPAFLALNDLCRARFGGGDAKFALSTALRSLGLPCNLPAEQAALTLSPSAAAEALEAAFLQKTVERCYLCPLDLADDLPTLGFGRTRVMQVPAADLAILFDAPRLARNFPKRPLDSKRLAQFHWLIVEDEIALDSRAEARAFPWLFKDIGRDLGEIDPHLGKYPAAVESALAFLLLAPWEQWSTMLEVDWRGFRVPWIYTISDDLFVRPNSPPSADDLTLEPWIVQDSWGEDVELERPTTIPLDDAATAGLAKLEESAWHKFVHACGSALFETPIIHFVVRAFLADGMDEVMAHMTAIEAGVGLETDYQRRSKTDPHKALGATQRVMARIAALLNDAQAARDYKDLFEMRSGYVHGRGGLSKVSTLDQVRARSLARRVASALVDLAARPARPRQVIMNELLDNGAPML